MTEGTHVVTNDAVPQKCANFVSNVKQYSIFRYFSTLSFVETTRYRLYVYLPFECISSTYNEYHDEGTLLRGGNRNLPFVLYVYVWGSPMLFPIILRVVAGCSNLCCGVSRYYSKCEKVAGIATAAGKVFFPLFCFPQLIKKIKAVSGTT